MSPIINKGSKQITDRGYFRRGIRGPTCTVSPICNTKVSPKKIKRSQQITDRGEFGGSWTFSRHRKRNRTAKNSVIVRPLKVNWAVCINLINNVSKVITNNQSSNCLAVPYIHCAKADAKKMTAQKKKQIKKIGFLSKKARQNWVQNCLTSKNLCPILII